MIHKMYAGTVAARLAAVVQHRHVAHHGKIVDALARQPGSQRRGPESCFEQHLSCAAPRRRYGRD